MNPFVEYREHLDIYRRAIDGGISDADFISMVVDANAEIIELEGFGFVQTPVAELEINGQPLIIKSETGAVGGSHKARHLFGLLLGLIVDERLNTSQRSGDLAIASCGNAALGAAVIACAARRPLRVFVPTDASEFVLDRMAYLGATVEVCERQPGQIGDPCIARLDEALTAGATAFTVQGTLDPASIDGCRTLGLELADQLTSAGIVATDLYIQIGGGALATATMDGLVRADYPLPRLHPVQARAAHPYVAAWNKISGLVESGMDRSAAEALVGANAGAMQPWPEPPHSVAHGILDDITYDWQTVAVHQIVSDGYPILVEEDQFVAAAKALADLVEPAPDETGAAAVAGWMADRRRENDAVSVALVTGAKHTD